MGGPKYPPVCARCGRELKRSEMVGVGYEPCPDHPGAGSTYRLQDDQYGYPAGWPRCHCGRPVLDGHSTCGSVECDEYAHR